MDGNCWESVPVTEINKAKKFHKITFEGYHNKDRIFIRLDKDGLICQENNETNIIKYQHIMNVKRSKSKPEVCVNHLRRTSNLIIQFQRFKIKFDSNDLSENLSKSISKQIKKKFNRIKSLVIIIDKIPNRCKLDGNSLFDEYMKATIKELKITHVIKEIYSTKDIDDLKNQYDTIKSSDGIVIISGDETASSIISDIINFFQTDKCFVKHVPVPFVIIPIGYHNDISRSIWLDENIQNIFLNIFLCKTFQTDVLSITKDGAKDSVWGFNCHYGFYSVFEKYRIENIDMKENLLIKKTLKQIKCFDCAIQYTLSKTSPGHPLDENTCNKNCSSCNLMTVSLSNTQVYKLNSSTQSNSTDSENYETMKNTNDVYWIIVNCIPCRNEIIENAFTPACHFNDGSADVVLVKSTNINDIKKYLKCHNVQGSHLRLPFVETKRIEDMHVTLKMNLSWSNNNSNSILESPSSKMNKNNDIIIEDNDLSSSSEQEETKEYKTESAKSTQLESITKKKKINKFLSPVMKVCKELTRSSPTSQESDDYKKPNMLESDKERERKAAKQKRKNSEFKKFETRWMLDYNFIDNVSSSVNIKVHSGVVSFFGDAMD